nr:MAG TPA: hypothetical protein [Caudoviricetes sp.]
MYKLTVISARLYNSSYLSVSSKPNLRYSG